jgi:hypothetical protein
MGDVVTVLEGLQETKGKILKAIPEEENIWYASVLYKSWTPSAGMLSVLCWLYVLALVIPRFGGFSNVT